MSKSRWVIDPSNIVHAAVCGKRADNTVPYMVKIADEALMLSHIWQQDLRDGHSGPGILTACDECIVSIADIEKG